MSGDFTLDQKRYSKASPRALAPRVRERVSVKPTGPAPSISRRKDRVTNSGGKLCDQEKWKREEHPFDGYPRLVAQAQGMNRPSRRTIFAGAITACSMSRQRKISTCAGCAFQRRYRTGKFAALADLAENFGGGYLHVTTRANIQIREIEPKDAVKIIEGVQDAGLVEQSSGADNIRNITGTPTAGVDPQELIDTRPFARAMHHHVLNDRSLYGLPRKFNVAFDGAGRVGALEDTNDIGFRLWRRSPRTGWSRRLFPLGSRRNHWPQDFARDTGVIVPPGEAIEVADKILRVFIEHGDRANRAMRG